MAAVDYRTLLDQLIRIEGVRLAPYRDAAGNLIVALMITWKEWESEDAEWLSLRWTCVRSPENSKNNGQP